MRTSNILFTSLLLIALGCTSPKANPIANSNGNANPISSPALSLSLPTENPFIPGKYITTEEGNLYTVRDTITISHISNQSNRFRVSRSSSYQKKTAGGEQPYEYDRTAWFGLYDDVSQSLTGVSNTITLHCLPARQQLTLEGVTYTRIE